MLMRTENKRDLEPKLDINLTSTYRGIVIYYRHYRQQPQEAMLRKPSDLALFGIDLLLGVKRTSGFCKTQAHHHQSSRLLSSGLTQFTR